MECKEAEMKTTIKERLDKLSEEKESIRKCIMELEKSKVEMEKEKSKVEIEKEKTRQLQFNSEIEKEKTRQLGLTSTPSGVFFCIIYCFIILFIH